MISQTEIPDFNKKFDVVSVFIEHEGEILLLHRQDHKPQGDTWAVLAGKVDHGEELAGALIREIEEEIGLKIEEDKLKYFKGYFVKYPEYDFMFHVFHLVLEERPSLYINKDEHKDHQWMKPQDALQLNLIQDEDLSIKWFYNLE